MRCKNLSCNGKLFVPVVELVDVQRLIGVRCVNCGAPYTVDELEIIAERRSWTSTRWRLEER